ncbi:MAG: PorT family protein [Spirochaetota bacterium]|nr:PorT family protein [Spirochaetota bacterium]
MLKCLIKKIKLKLILILILVIFAIPCHAEYLEIGLKGIFGASRIKRMEAKDYDPILGYGIGGSLTLHLHNTLNFELDMLFITRGARITSGSTVETIYLATPFIIKSDPFGWGNFFLLGIQPNLLLKASLDDRFSHSINLISHLNKFVIDFVFGIGYQVDFLSIEIRYEHGLSDIFKNDNYFGQGTEKNSSIYLIVGANFKL